MIFDQLKFFRKDYSILLILILSFFIRIGCGLYSGAANADAGDYTTLAIQMANENNYSFIIDTTSNRQVFQLWLLVLTVFMKILGATNLTAIIIISFFGTFSIFVFYKVLKLFFNNSSSLLITVLFSIIPLIISIQQNPLYDGFLLFVLLTAIYFYFNFLNNGKIIHLVLSGCFGTCLPFIHPSAYIYVFIIWFLFPFFYRGKALIKEWVIFSVIIGLLPVLQLLVWKHLYGIYYPYQKMIEEWFSLKDRGFSIPGRSIKSLINYYLVFFVSISPLIFFAILAFVADIKLKTWKNLILLLIYFICILLIVYLIGLNTILLIFIPLSFVLLFKQKVLKENKFMFLCGTISLIMLSLFVGISDNMAPQKRGFAYIITFSTPILWFYGNKLIHSKRNLFSGLIIFYIIMFIAAFYFNLSRNQNKMVPYFNKKYSVALNVYLPYDRQPDKVLASLKWLQEQNFRSDQYLLTNIWGRYIPANLNMSQNHCLIATGESYSITKGFEEVKLSVYSDWVKKNKPGYVIWDKILNDKCYNIIDNKGKHMMTFTYQEFLFEIEKNYNVNVLMPDSVFIFKRMIE
jgi:Dolichyl-phosphate-mannose-protein mannosyltransferase